MLCRSVYKIPFQDEHMFIDKAYSMAGVLQLPTQHMSLSLRSIFTEMYEGPFIMEDSIWKVPSELKDAGAFSTPSPARPTMAITPSAAPRPSAAPSPAETEPAKGGGGSSSYAGSVASRPPP